MKKLVFEYKEGAKGRCFFCGKPEAEHRERLCPQFAERDDVTGRTVRGPGGKLRESRSAQGVGILR